MDPPLPRHSGLKSMDARSARELPGPALEDVRYTRDSWSSSFPASAGHTEDGSRSKDPCCVLQYKRGMLSRGTCFRRSRGPHDGGSFRVWSLLHLTNTSKDPSNNCCHDCLGDEWLGEGMSASDSQSQAPSQQSQSSSQQSAPSYSAALPKFVAKKHELVDMHLPKDIHVRYTKALLRGRHPRSYRPGTAIWDFM
jgi:hypothetical protein